MMNINMDAMNTMTNELEALHGFAIRVHDRNGLRAYADTEAIAAELERRNAKIEPINGYAFTFEQQLAIVENMMSQMN
jgi:hypothetical protein